MSRKQQIFEDVLQGAYSLEKFTRFSRELFTGLNISSARAQKPPQNFFEHIKEYYVLGRQDDIAVLAVNLQKNKSVERARSVQRNFVKALIEDDIAVDGAKSSATDKKIFKKNFLCTKTITGRQKDSTDTFALFIEKSFNLCNTGGIVNLIVPMSVTSSDAMTALYNLLEGQFLYR